MSTTTRAADEQVDPGIADLREELRRLLLELSEGKLAGVAIDPAADLFNQGYVDSLSAVAFIARIEERWGVAIDDMDLVERYSSLDAVAAHVAARRC
jgi:acyl carrier protein